MQVKTNDLILKNFTVLISFILFGFAVHLFFAGHNEPGGGFVGGLMTAAAILLMYMAYGEKTVNKVLPFNYRLLIIIGLAVAVLTGIGSFVFDVPFLSHTFTHVHVPIFGEIELATALFFDLGVYLTVVGVTVTIILTISRDRD